MAKAGLFKDFLWISANVRHFVHIFLLAKIIFLSTYMGNNGTETLLVNCFLQEIIWKQGVISFIGAFHVNNLNLISCESAQISCPHCGRVCGDYRGMGKGNKNLIVFC